MPFVIYSSTGAVSPQGYYFAVALTVYKPNRIWDGGPKGLPHACASARFSALILSLHCTHPIQLGSIMGLLRRVKICSHFFFFLLDATIRAAPTWDETSSPLLFLSLSLPQSLLHTFSFLRLAVFHGVMILLLISPWLSSSFGKMWESKLCSGCCLIKLGIEAARRF